MSYKDSTTLASSVQCYAEKFWKRVNKSHPSGCWLWTASCYGSGHGRFVYKRSKAFLAHRVAYLLTRGDIPPGLHVCHSCDVPSCVNPEHLWLGSQGDNIRDASRKGRMLHGRHHPHALLTEEQVAEMIHAYFEEGRLLKELALQYGVNSGTVGKIMRGKTWKHIIRSHAPRRRNTHMMKYSKEQINNACQLHTQGMTRAAVARQTGISPTHIFYLIHRLVRLPDLD